MSDEATQTATEPAGSEVSLADRIKTRIQSEVLGETPMSSPTPAEPVSEPAPVSEDIPGDEAAKSEPDEKPKRGRPKKTAKAPTLEDFISDAEPAETDGEAEPEVADESDDDEVPDEVQKQGAKATARWKELKAEASEAKRLRAELERLQASKSDDALAKLEAENKELKARSEEQAKSLAAYDVTRSDEYRREVIEPINAIDRAIGVIAGDDAEVAEAIRSAMLDTNLKSRAAKLSEITDDMSEYEKNKIYRLVDEADVVFERREHLVANAATAKEEMERRRLAEESQRSEIDRDARSAAAEKVWKNMTKLMPFMLDEEGNLRDEYAAVRSAGKEDAIAEMDIRQQVFAGYSKHLVPQMVKEISSLQEQLAEARDTVKALKGASPTMGNASERAEPTSDEPLARRIAKLARESNLMFG